MLSRRLTVGWGWHPRLSFCPRFARGSMDTDFSLKVRGYCSRLRCKLAWRPTRLLDRNTVDVITL
jgi:hypothetical protein